MFCIYVLNHLFINAVSCLRGTWTESREVCEHPCPGLAVGGPKFAATASACLCQDGYARWGILFASLWTCTSNWTIVRLLHGLSAGPARPPLLPFDGRHYAQDGACETISMMMLIFAPGMTACIDFAHPHNVPCTNIVEVLLPWPNLKVTFLAFLLHEPFHILTVILISIKTSLAKYLHNRSWRCAI
jgi:hypothetical protein